MTSETLQNRRNNDYRRTEESLIDRRNNDLRRTDQSLETRRNNDLRMTSETLQNRRNNDYRRTEVGLIDRRNNDSRRTENSIKVRRNNDLRRSTEKLFLRKDTDQRRSENNIKERSYRYQNRPLEDLIKEYEQSIRSGPVNCCQCCGCLFFNSGIQRILKSNLVEKWVDRFDEINCIKNNDDHLQLCITCAKDIRKGIVPRLCLNNGFWFPKIPPELRDLSPLEERLVSPRLPFMQIRSLRVGQQKGLKGNVVNVSIPIEKSIEVLPRTFDKNGNSPNGFEKNEIA